MLMDFKPKVKVLVLTAHIKLLFKNQQKHKKIIFRFLDHRSSTKSTRKRAHSGKKQSLRSK